MAVKPPALATVPRRGYARVIQGRAPWDLAGRTERRMASAQSIKEITMSATYHFRRPSLHRAWGVVGGSLDLGREERS